MGSQEFCLKWNNHQGNLIEVFDDLLRHEAFVDVTLACQGLSLKVHKVVLSACSSFFRELFQTNPCKHPIVFMSDVNFPDLQAIIEFMYKGQVNVSQERLPGLLKTAESLHVKGLAEVQADKMSSNGEILQPQQQKRKRSNSGSSSQPKPTQTRQFNIPDKVNSLNNVKVKKTKDAMPSSQNQSSNFSSAKDQNMLDETSDCASNQLTINQSDSSSPSISQNIKCSPPSSPTQSIDIDMNSGVDTNQFLVQQFSCSEANITPKIEATQSCSNVVRSQSVFPTNVNLPYEGMNPPPSSSSSSSANPPFIEQQDFSTISVTQSSQPDASFQNISSQANSLVMNFIDAVPNLDGFTPEKQWRTRGRPASWSQENLKLAMSAVLKDRWSVTAAARSFGIPQPTLHSYISKFYKQHMASLTIAAPPPNLPPTSSVTPHQMEVTPHQMEVTPQSPNVNIGESQSPPAENFQQKCE